MALWNIKGWGAQLGRVGFAWLWAVMATVALPAITSPAMAASLPRVGFDASTAIECRDVTPEDFAAANPAEKIVEARFRISILFEEGEQDHVEDVMVLIESPEKRLRAIDFSPKTELSTDVAGPIEATDTSEHTFGGSGTLGASIGGHATAEASLNASQRQVNNRKYHQLPAKYVVLASGTTLGEHGVFFKIKGSPQTSLEGLKEFTCLFVVPRNWRADWCLLSCRARASRKNYLSTKIEPCGQADLIVGLYMAGDEQGKALARRLDRVQVPPSASTRQAMAAASTGNGAQAMNSTAQKADFGTTVSSFFHLSKPTSESRPVRPAVTNTLSGLREMSGGR